MTHSVTIGDTAQVKTPAANPGNLSSVPQTHSDRRKPIPTS